MVTCRGTVHDYLLLSSVRDIKPLNFTTSLVGYGYQGY